MGREGNQRDAPEPKLRTDPENVINSSLKTQLPAQVGAVLPGFSRVSRCL